MAQRVNPSPELVKLLARISQLSLDDATITKVELKSKDGRPAKMQVSRIDWPSEHNAIVEQATQKAVDETKAQIKLLAPQCQEWFANTLLLEEGSLRPKEGKAGLVIPIIGASSLPTKINFHHLTAKPGEPEEWRTQLYILESNMCIRVMEGKLLYISVLCRERQQLGHESDGTPVQPQ